MVHIKISDKGWILERLAREIADRLPYVSYDTSTNTDATIQYYMTYGCRQQRVSPIEIALFTHKEKTPSAAEKFERVASEVDYCVAQSFATEAVLRSQNINRIVTISPGVDLERFSPKVKIGVVGRTYHTGRKGEALVASVMDVPGIEWHFTGPGWPGPAEFIAEEDMPDFYRSLDYVLVPALIEGGPMCVLEALASGCEVIGPPVGWVPQFPHVGFELGNANDLRRVLLDLAQKKQELRKSVEAYTWDSWASRHHQLFSQLLGYDPLTERDKSGIFIHAATNDDSALKVAVFVHGDEMKGSRGGPSVRAPRTASALRRIGIAAEFHASRAMDASRYDVSHIFNIWAPNSCNILLRQIEKAGTASVLSPIFLDLTELPLFQRELPRILQDTDTIDDLRLQIADLREKLEEQQTKPVEALEPFDGYFSTIRLLTSRADHLILLSDHEKKLLDAIGVVHPSTSIVKNPVDAKLFGEGDPSLFEAQFGVKDYVLCVARVESRKNQALLALALRDSGIPLVLVGHEADPQYSSLIRKWGGNVIFAGRMEPGSPMLASALAGARVFCLPSWSEGAPLAALEAAAAGCNMVLSNRSSEEEYFGDLARYVDPANPDDIRSKVLDAYSDAQWETRRSQLHELIRTNHSWDRYARDTADAYIAAKSRHSVRSMVEPSIAATQEVFVDVTTLANHVGPPTGIARVEDRLVSEFMSRSDVTCRFVVWNSIRMKFMEVSSRLITSGAIKELATGLAPALLRNDLDHTPGAEVDFHDGARFVVLGSAWMRNANYLSHLWAVKSTYNLSLIVAVYDVIQFNHKELYPAEASETFTRNCTRLLDIADLVLTCSDASRRDIIDMCITQAIPVPPIELFRLGDEPGSLDSLAVVQQDMVAPLAGTAFVLYVSSLDARKNHSLLFNVWQRLRKENGASIPKLVVVGRMGWNGEQILHLLTSDRDLQKHIIVLQDVSDLTLGWLYDNCLFTVYPSLYEGWGLPVAESLRHGKLCIASSAGSIGEIAPGIVEYIDPLDFIGWLKAVKRYVFNHDLLEQRTRSLIDYVPTSWKETAAQVLSAVAEARQKSQFPVLSIGPTQELFASQNVSTDLILSYLAGGWARVEGNGIWSIGGLSRIGFRLDQASSQHLTLQMTAFGYAAHIEPVEVVVTVNGATVARWAVGAKPAAYYAPLPSSLISENADLIVDFSVLNPRAPMAFEKSSDSRLLGFKAQAMSIQAPTALEPELWQTIDLLRSDLTIALPTGEQRAKFLSIAIYSDAVGAVSITIDHSDVVATINMLADEQVVHALDISPFIDKGKQVLNIRVSMERPEKQVYIREIGLFDHRPLATLERVVVSTKNKRGTSGHVALAGSVPTLETGQMMLPRDFTNGLAGGWHAPEPSGVWMNGRAASLHLHLKQANEPSLREVLIYFSIFEPLRYSRETFQIKIGQQDICTLIAAGAYARASDELIARFAIAPHDMDSNGNLAITFFSSGAIAPSALHISTDCRPLAIKLHHVVVMERAIQAIETGASDLGISEQRSNGWWEAESDGQWSDGTDSPLLVYVPAGYGPAKLEIGLASYVAARQGRAVRLVVRQGDVLSSLMIGPTAENYLIPLAVDAEGQQVRISFSCEDAARPSDLGESLDERLLSFKLLHWSVARDSHQAAITEQEQPVQTGTGRIANSR